MRPPTDTWRRSRTSSRRVREPRPSGGQYVDREPTVRRERRCLRMHCAASRGKDVTAHDGLAAVVEAMDRG